MHLHLPRSVATRIALLCAVLMVVLLTLGALLMNLQSKSILLDQVDQELIKLANLGIRNAEGTDNPLSQGRGQQRGIGNVLLNRATCDFAPPGAPNGYVRMCVGPSATVGVLIDDRQLRHLESAEQLHTLAVSTSAPTTVRIDEMGAYRVLNRQQGDTLVVTGLPLRDMQHSLDQLTRSQLVIIGLTTTLAIGLLTWVVRRNLKPLSAVSASAQGLVDTDLTSGSVDLSRFTVANTTRADEIGTVATAFNDLVAHVQTTLDTREANEQQMERFVSDASHELRTPLAAVQGYCEIVRRYHPEADPAVRQALNRIESESQRMSALVNDLLTLQRADQTPLDARTDADLIDLVTLVEDVLETARVLAPDHAFALSASSSLRPVLLDVLTMRRALENIISNAHQHTPPGTSVLVSVQQDAANTTLVISNDGPEIPSALLPRLFDRFTREDTSRVREAGRSGGYGLGLAISQTIVEAHGGTLRATSGPESTVFTILLPISQVRD